MSIATISAGGRLITVDTRWDDEAGVWTATGTNIDGLVVKADKWPAVIEEIQLIVPELLAVTSTNAPLPDVR